MGSLRLSKSLLEAQNRWWNIWADIPTKSPSATRESEKLMRKRSLFRLQRLPSKRHQKQMVLSHEEFIRRFCDAYFAEKICKIRHYGFEQHLKRIALKLQIKLGIQPKEKLRQKFFSRNVVVVKLEIW